MSVYVVFRESGEYSDHRFEVLCVAKSASDAAAACEHYARRQEEPDFGAAGVFVRPTRDGDKRHGEGWWVVMQTYEWSEPEEIETDRADDYDVTFGLQEIATWGES